MGGREAVARAFAAILLGVSLSTQLGANVLRTVRDRHFGEGRRRRGPAAVVSAWLVTFLVLGALMPPASSLEPDVHLAHASRLVGDALLPADWTSRYGVHASENEVSVPEPGFLDTSRYMMGSVAFSIILPESTGAIDPNQEDWTPTEIATVISKIKEGLAWWASLRPDAFVSFVDNYYVVNTGYEPINHPQWEEWLWIHDVMAALGYPSGDRFDRVRTFDNDLRDSLGTDWAFTIFVVDSTVDLDGKFADGQYFAYAYFGGPFLVMTYDNDGWGIGNMHGVTAHELGHIFWATDEYDAVSQFSGYLHVEEVSQSGCLMHTGVIGCLSDGSPSGSRGTTGQIGWRDWGDNPGVMDILDVPPETSLAVYTPDPTDDDTPTFTGSTTVVAYPSYEGAWVTINTIANVEFRVDGGPWAPSIPVDGSFDEAVESFTFTTPSLRDGVHTIEARAKIVVPTLSTTTIYDPTPASDTLTVKIAGPTSSVDFLPTYTAVRPFVVTVTATATPGLGLKQVSLWFSREGSAYQSYGTDTEPPWQFLFEISLTGGDGSYSFFSIAVDNADQAEDPPPVADTTTLVDTRAPTSGVRALPAYANQPTVAIVYDASDSGSGVGSVTLWYGKDGAPYLKYAEVSGGCFVPEGCRLPFDTSAVGGDGAYAFYTIAADLAGNEEPRPAQADASTIVDRLAPSSSVEPLPAYTGTRLLTVNAAASDASGVASIELFYRKDGGAWTSFGIDAASPWSWAFDVSSIGDGTYEFHSIAVDVAGNAEPAPASPDATTTVDTRIPSSSVDPLPAYTMNATFSVTASATDPGGTGVATVTLFYRKTAGTWSLWRTDTSAPWSWTFETLLTGGDGLYEFYAIAVDAAGNAGAKAIGEASTVVDTSPPASSHTLSGTPGDNGWYTTAVTITLKATDAGSGVAATYFRIAGGTWFPYEDPLTISDEGLHTVEYYSVDGVGHAGSVLTIGIKIDGTPPAVTFVSPEPERWLSGASVTVTWAGADETSGVDRYEVSVDGNPAPTVVIGQLFLDGFDDGIHAVVVRAYDRAGNVAEATLSFGVDTRPPAVTVRFPAEGSTVYESSVPVTWSSVEDGSGIAKCLVALDDGETVEAQSERSLTFPNLPDGEHRATVACVDVVGNIGTATVVFYVASSFLGVPWAFVPWLLFGFVSLAVALAVLLRKRKGERRTR